MVNLPPAPAALPGVPTPPATRSRGRTVASFIWAALPLITFGWTTWAAFLFAAIRCRSWWLAAVSALYAAPVAAAFAHHGSLGGVIVPVFILGCVMGGSAHAFASRSRVFGMRQPRGADLLHLAEQEALRRRKLREEARALATRDPALARQLGIGRPDLRRSYDDGGLVDVNSAPAAVLATLPGMTFELAEQAVEMRRSRGPFVSADDLSVALRLRPELVPALADVTAYPA